MPITSLFEHFSTKSRRLKMELLAEYLPLSPDETVLDVGSEIDSQARQLLERLPDKKRITAINLTIAHLVTIRDSFPGSHPIKADACHLPFPDKSFDIVYSNAVIEHVGGIREQTLMAQEVQRVGRKWFITTPNRWYPFEFHARMPLISWLPASLMHKVARIWSFNHSRRRYSRGNDYTHVQLLTAGQLREMFPNSLIIKPRVTFWPETLVVVGPTDSSGRLT